MANLSWISSNPDYINQMIRNTQVTLSNNYNDLDNIPIIKITSTTNNPQKIWELREGLYIIDGVVQVDNNTSYEVSNLLISMTARLENGKYVLSAFIPYLRGLFEYILKTNSTEYEQHQKIVLMIKNDTLTLDNETIYTPIEDYHPATKKYVDDKANEIVAELDRMGVNKENLESLSKENRIRDIKLQALLSETSDRNITIEENVRYFDMPLSIDSGIVTINEMVGETLVNVCDQEESVAITKSYTVENENHIALQGEYDGSCRPIVHGNTLVNHNADWDDNLQTGIETSASGIEDVVVEGIKGQEVSVVVEGNTVLNHALGKTSAVVADIKNSINLLNRDITLQGNSSVNNGVYIIVKNYSLFKPSTIYTFMYEVKNCTTTNNLFLFASNLTVVDTTVSLNTSVGKHTVTFTTKDILGSSITHGLYIHLIGSNATVDTSNQLVLCNMLVLEGDHTTNPKYVNSNEGNYVDLTVANDMSSVVEIEGRTMVNVCDQKDPIAITKSYTVENSGNHIALQGEYDGSCRPVIQGNTMVNLCENKWYAQNDNMVYSLCKGVKSNTTYTLIPLKGEGNNKFSVYDSAGVTPILTYDTSIRSFYTGELTEIKVFGYNNVDGMTTDYPLNSVMVFEGDLTQTPELIPTEYVEGLKSSFEDGYIPEDITEDLEELAVEPGQGNVVNVPISNIKPNTKYTVYAPVLEGNYIALRFRVPDGEELSTGVDSNTSFTNPMIIKTYDDTYDFSNVILRYYCSLSKGTSFSTKDVKILEGDWTHLTEEDFNHLGKYKVEYKVTGKNKFDGELELGSFSFSNGVELADTNIRRSKNFMEVNGGEILALSSSNVNADIQYIFEYDKNKEFIKYSAVYGKVTLSDETKFIRFRSQTDGTNGYTLPTENPNIQIEEGSEATPYEPYKEYTKTFYLNSPLLEGDTIEDVNGKATHVKRYGKVVLDGSDDEGWFLMENQENTIRFKKGLNAIAVIGSSRVFADTLPSDTEKRGICLMRLDYNIGGLQIILNKSEMSSSNLTGFLKWLQANPTTVVYELASPIYEPISNESILCDSYANGHLDFDSAVPIEKVEFKNTGMYLKCIQDNTKYTIQFESDNIGYIKAISIPNGILRNISVTKGKNVLSMTSGNNTSSQWRGLAIDGIGFNASNIVVTEAIDADFDYFEGLSSSYESCYPGGKNLFDGVIDDSGHSSLIDISNLTNVIVSSSNYSEGMAYIRFYDKNKNKILTDINFNNVKGFSNNAHYLQVLYANYRPNLQVEEGLSSTSYEPFIDKYKVDVKVIGKNILHFNNYTIGALNTNGSIQSNNQSYRTSDYIKVKPNTNYIRSGFSEHIKDSIVRRTYTFYDINKNCIGWGNLDSIITPHNCYYIRTGMTTEDTYIDGILTTYKDNIDSLQLEEGTVATSYEPYFESTKTFYLNSPLLEGDKIVTKNGKVYHYHKMGKVVLDGSRDWWGSSNINGITFMATTSLFNLGTSDRKILCDSLRVNQGINQDKFTDYNEILAHKLSSYSNACYISTQLSQSDFINWLKSNPITVAYELDTPYYELVDEYNNTILNIPKNVAHLTHTSAVPVNNTTFTNYKDELNVLETNTQYRLMFDCDKANVPFTVTLGGTSQEVTSKKGTHSLLITTPTELVDKNLVIDGIGGCGIDNIRIFKGDVEYDYVKGLWSGYEERKLENLYDYVSCFSQHSTISYSDNIFTIIIASGNYPSIRLQLLSPLNIKKQYTIIFEAKSTVPDKRIKWGGCKASTSSAWNVRQLPDLSNVKYLTTSYKQYCSIISYKLDDGVNDNIGFGFFTQRDEQWRYEKIYIKNILILEGDWTDNPPTYEEVMANEGKYAVKVKLDTNATIFGKGGRL